MKVVQIGFAVRHKFFTNPNWEWQIRHAIAMQVPDLSAADMKENHPAPMGFDGHSFPRTHFILDRCSNRFREHDLHINVALDTSLTALISGMGFNFE
jgi:hypothetical protein